MLVADFYVFLRFTDMADSDLLDEGVSTGVSVTVVIFLASIVTFLLFTCYSQTPVDISELH